MHGAEVLPTIAARRNREGRDTLALRAELEESEPAMDYILPRFSINAFTSG